MKTYKITLTLTDKTESISIIQRAANAIAALEEVSHTFDINEKNTTIIIEEEKPMVNEDLKFASEVFEAMDKTKGWGCLWYEDDKIMKVLNKAILRGWIVKYSTTQVEYTEKAESELFPMYDLI